MLLGHLVEYKRLQPVETCTLPFFKEYTSMRKLLASLFSILSFTGFSQSITPFSIWKQVTQRGDITFTGNSNLTCNGGATCTTALAAVSPTGNGAGNNFNNNGLTMIYNNIADATDPVARFSRTNANLTLGSTGGCGVIYAELVWGGNILAATVNYAKRDSVYLRTPAGGYTGLKADIKTDAAIPFGGYYCYKDVTSLVRQGGTGTYWLANVVNDNNATNLCGGWALVVIYGDPLLPLRNLTVFRGISSINAANPQNIPISGFFTPPAPAAINLKLGVYSFEGDRGTLGDSLKFNGNPTFGFLSVTDSKHPANNAFNSTINNNTAEITRNPSSPNTLGIDLDIFVPDNTAFNYLKNGVSSATLRMTSSGDVYAPFMVSTVIDVFEPDIQLTKTFVNINGNNPAQLGDTIEYTLKVVNKGNDPSDSLLVVDSLYGAMNYVANSIQILTGPNSGLKTDGSGDDQAEFFAAGNYLKVRLGNGANAVKGGKMGITALTDSVSTFKFRVKITTDCNIFHCMDSVKNTAYATFYGQTSLEGRTTASSPSGFDAFGCPIQGATQLRVFIPPCVPVADTSFVACSPYNLSNLLPARPGYSSFYNSSWASVTQAVTTGTYYAIKEIYPGCNDTIQINANLPCTLPIILKSFNAEYKEKYIDISWVTASEINNDHFDVERSLDGITYSKIGSVSGAGNSNTTKFYVLQDFNFPGVSVLYYRLKLVDRDGQYSLSAVKAVRLPSGNLSMLAIDGIVPNPVKNITNIRLFANTDLNARLTIIDVSGKAIMIQTKKIQKGTNNIVLDLNSLPNGMYLVQITDLQYGNKTTGKIMISR